MSAGLVTHPRCPACTAPTEGNKCGLGCEIARCVEPECRELIEVGKPHECAPTPPIPNTTQTQETP